MFTDRSAAEDEEDARREILGETGRSSRGFKPPAPRSRYAFTGKRPESSPVSSRDSGGNSIDVISDGDNDHPEAEEKKPLVRKSSDISFAERSGRRQ
jgi:hypothetical protein